VTSPAWPATRSGAVTGMDGTTNPASVHLGIVCARQEDGTSLVGLYVNGVLIDAYRDRAGYRSFRQVAVYTDTYPGTVGFDSFRASTLPRASWTRSARRLRDARPEPWVRRRHGLGRA
jgi:hypothetical protein